MCGGGGCLSQHVPKEARLSPRLADFLLGGMLSPGGLVDPWEPGSLRDLGRKGPKFPRARLSAPAWGGGVGGYSTLGGALERKMAPNWEREGDKPGSFGTGGRRFFLCVPFPVGGGGREAPGLKEGGQEGTVRAAGMGQGPGPQVSPSLPLPKAPASPTLHVFCMAASVSLPLQPGPQFFAKRFPSIPATKPVAVPPPPPRECCLRGSG